jgi:allophanate hydrolase
MRVVAVPAGELDLDPVHRLAWEAALAHARTVASRVIEVDISPLLEAAAILYGPAFVAMRWAAFGAQLDGLGVDPVVRRVVTAGRDARAADLVSAQDRLVALRRQAETLWADVDALLLPTTPTHPTHAEVAADPYGVNARLGTYTNFVNLLDLCAVAVPAGSREDGLPFGVQLIAPAFGDAPLLDLAERWCGGAVPAATAGPGRTLVALAGAHMSGLALNGQVLALGGRLHSRVRTAPGYSLYRLPGAGVARPGLVRTGDGPADGIALELWDLPHQGVGALLDLIPSPLGLGRVALEDGRQVTGFLSETAGVVGATDISDHGGWRAYLSAQA